MEAKRHDIHGQWVTEDAKDIGVFLEKIMFLNFLKENFIDNNDE